MKSSWFLFVLVICVVELSLGSSQRKSSVLRETSSTHRIVGGYPISIRKAPWTVQIIYNGIYICGGSIVSRTKILSAAHCTATFDKKKFVIRAGSSKFNAGQVRRVSKIIEHSQYSPSGTANDISMLSITKPLRLSSKVAVISIDDSSSVLPEGTKVLATGWGRTCENCNIPKSLRAVKLPVIGNNRCSKMYKNYAHKVLPTNLCCGLKNGGKDTCQGDSGGPIMFNKTLVGIVSFGVGCARPNLPGVYTRVSSFASWIKGYL